jgi:pyridoxal 5'-phosphate synthase pdxT subunit
MVTVGVLALQGDFAAHGRALRRLGVATLAVRKAADLDAIDALVLPGGESTAMLHGLARDGLEAPLRSVLVSGRPVLGTCAGAILLASRVTNPPQRSFAALDIDVERNAYGTQVDSFAAPLDGAAPLRGLRGVFIRAPRIRRVGAGVEVLARHAGEPVLVRDGVVWAATFHPELDDDDRVLRLWLDAESRSVSAVIGA